MDIGIPTLQESIKGFAISEQSRGTEVLARDKD